MAATDKVASCPTLRCGFSTVERLSLHPVLLKLGNFTRQLVQKSIGYDRAEYQIRIAASPEFEHVGALGVDHRRRQLMQQRFLKTALAFALAGAGLAAHAATDLVIATVNNGHMIEMQKLTPQFFEKANPDIKLKWVTLEEGTLRQRVTTDIATKGGQFDVMTIGMYETPIWGKKGWLKPSSRPTPPTTSTTCCRPCATACRSTASSTPRRSTARARC